MLLILIDVFALGERLFSNFKAHEHEFGCSRCFQHRIWEQASDWLNSFMDGGEETQKRVDQLGFASNSLSNPSSFTLYIGL